MMLFNENSSRLPAFFHEFTETSQFEFKLSSENTILYDASSLQELKC
jgi:hypothetical protein